MSGKGLENFKDSAPLSLGVELELQLVSRRDFDLTRGATDLLGSLDYDGRWHSAQHTRQLAMMLESHGIVPDRPLTAADLAGLPVPDDVWG